MSTMPHIAALKLTGSLTSEQLMVLQQVAVTYLRHQDRNIIMAFKHALCDGVIVRKKETVVWGIAGTIFYADLGPDKGARRTCEFLLPRGVEEFPLDDHTLVIACARHGGDASQVDMEKVFIEAGAMTAHSVQ